MALSDDHDISTLDDAMSLRDSTNLTDYQTSDGPHYSPGKGRCRAVDLRGCVF